MPAGSAPRAGTPLQHSAVAKRNERHQATAFRQTAYGCAWNQACAQSCNTAPCVVVPSQDDDSPHPVWGSGRQWKLFAPSLGVQGDHLRQLSTSLSLPSYRICLCLPTNLPPHVLPKLKSPSRSVLMHVSMHCEHTSSPPLSVFFRVLALVITTTLQLVYIYVGCPKEKKGQRRHSMQVPTGSLNA